MKGRKKTKEDGGKIHLSPSPFYRACYQERLSSRDKCVRANFKCKQLAFGRADFEIQDLIRMPKCFEFRGGKAYRDDIDLFVC